MTEISVRYNQYHCPKHDLAGWRKEGAPNPSCLMCTPQFVPESTVA
ncbi:hypothetical protein [uncultured Thiothrix sp.]|nr:hypothetical protein [uncultured Thiothrix sp.]